MQWEFPLWTFWYRKAHVHATHGKINLCERSSPSAHLLPYKCTNAWEMSANRCNCAISRQCMPIELVGSHLQCMSDAWNMFFRALNWSRCSHLPFRLPINSPFSFPHNITTVVCLPHGQDSVEIAIARYPLHCYFEMNSSRSWSVVGAKAFWDRHKCCPCRRCWRKSCEQLGSALANHSAPNARKWKFKTWLPRIPK